MDRGGGPCGVPGLTPASRKLRSRYGLPDRSSAGTCPESCTARDDSGPRTARTKAIAARWSRNSCWAGGIPGCVAERRPAVGLILRRRPVDHVVNAETRPGPGLDPSDPAISRSGDYKAGFASLGWPWRRPNHPGACTRWAEIEHEPTPGLLRSAHGSGLRCTGYGYGRKAKANPSG